MERRFPRTVDALEDLFGFVSDFATRYGLGEDAIFESKLAIEEVFVNMIRHDTGKRYILVSLVRDGNRLTITLTDFDARGFDITKADEYDTRRSLEERPIGGLGIHLVKSTVDEVTYHYENRRSRITLTKNLGKTDVQD
jgi:serine/threonine-protein kinase RsbW